MNNDGYIRVVEQFPELLMLDPVKDMQLIVSLSHAIGVKDGQTRAMEIMERVLAKKEIELAALSK